MWSWIDQHDPRVGQKNQIQKQFIFHILLVSSKLNIFIHLHISSPYQGNWHLLVQSMRTWIGVFFMTFNNLCTSTCTPQHFYFLALPVVIYMVLSITLALRMLYQSTSIRTVKVQKSFSAVNAKIQHMLKMKIIQPSLSDWGTPCILARKPFENWI